MGGLAKGADDGVGGGWRGGLAEDEGRRGGRASRRRKKDLLMCKRGEIWNKWRGAGLSENVDLQTSTNKLPIRETSQQGQSLNELSSHRLSCPLLLFLVGSIGETARDSVALLRQGGSCKH